MKNSKKVICILLILIVSISISVQVFAEDQMYKSFDLKSQQSIDGISADATKNLSEDCLAWTDKNRAINVYVPGYGHKVFKKKLSRSKPSVTTYKDRIYVAWTGINKKINIMSFNENFSDLKETKLNEKSNVGPAISSYYSLILSWTGTDNRINFLLSIDGSSWKDKHTTNETSYYSPSVCPAIFSRQLVNNADENKVTTFYVVWTDTNNEINIMIKDINSTEITSKRALSSNLINFKSYCAPSIYSMLTTNLIIWIGTDNKINTFYADKIFEYEYSSCGRFYEAYKGKDEPYYYSKSTPAIIYNGYRCSFYWNDLSTGKLNYWNKQLK